MKRRCLSCKADISKRHFNTKRCRPCARALAKSPAGKLTPKQEAIARRWAGKIFKKEVVKKVGTSWSNLGRWGTQNNVSFNALRYPDELVKKVSAFYEKHGKVKTQKRFKDIPIRSIVERRGKKYFSPRQIRWSDEEIAEAAKMAGLVSYQGQAKYFNRPRAHSGSIKSLWNKRFGFQGGSLNGMVHHHAKTLVNIKARYQKPTGQDRNDNLVKFRRIILWVDMEKCLKAGTPEFIKEAVKTMADFQRWIWRSKNPKPLILKMIKEREVK